VQECRCNVHECKGARVLVLGESCTLHLAPLHLPLYTLALAGLSFSRT
jgi:hypothetical protein